MAGYHEGEIAVQERAGVRDLGRRLESMLAGNYLMGRVVDFLEACEIALITGADGEGDLWTSPLIAAAGFLRAAGAELAVRALPRPGDPLDGLAVADEIGLAAIDFATRRRLRVNGVITAVDEAGFVIAIDQAYVNCPKHIQRRVLLDASPRPGPARSRRLERLGADEVALIGASDTVFLGTRHPDRGVDCSHRGGPAGFVRAEPSAGGAQRLWWPDYPGNNMFNSLGNLAVDPAASLLFLDFAGRRALHLSGSAALGWDRFGPGDDAGTGRRVEFTVRSAVLAERPELSASPAIQDGRNPPLSR